MQKYTFLNCDKNVEELILPEFNHISEFSGLSNHLQGSGIFVTFVA